MGAALIIMVLVAAGETTDLATSSVLAGLEQTARRPVTVSVREVGVVPDEAEAAWIAADEKVDVVAEVGWTGSARAHAVVHLHGRDGRVLRMSDLDFAPSEPKVERGRAVGFAIATMLADEPVAAGIVASTAAAEARVVETRAAVSALPAAPTPTPAPTAGAPPPDRIAVAGEGYPRFAIEGAGSAAADVRAGAVGAGPLMRVQWNVLRELGLRVGGGAKWFSASGQRASELGGTAGVLWTFARGRRFDAAARAELGVVRDAFTEEVSETNPRGKVLPSRSVDRVSWAPAFLAGIEGDFRPGRTSALFAALNVEASPRTVVARTVASSSVVWVSLEAGVRLSF